MPHDDANPLRTDPLPPDPWPLLTAWLDEAFARRDQPNPHSMYLATVDADGTPSVRAVLAKRLDPSGYVVFYTNYRSRKARALGSGPAAACFHWDHTERQIRIEGEVTRSPAHESDAYFATRPWESQIGAWASEQSEPIDSRDALMAKVLETMVERGVDPLGENQPAIPRPPHWGGYRLHARRVELWASGPGRVHDRGLWTRELRIGADGVEAGPWAVARLQP